MTKKKAAVSYKHVTPALVKQIKNVIEDADTRRTYSMSKIYGAHNAAFELKETAQNCPSCLKTRVANLRQFVRGLNEKVKGNAAPDDTAGEPNSVAPAPEPNATPDATPDHTPEELAQLREDFGLEADANDADLLASITAYLAEADDASDEERAKLTKLTAALTKTAEPVKVGAQYLDPSGPGFVEAATGVTRVPLKVGDDGTTEVLDFVPDADNAFKGKVKHADGKTVKPGKYVTGDGRDLSVQVGGKATFKVEDLT